MFWIIVTVLCLVAQGILIVTNLIAMIVNLLEGNGAKFLGHLIATPLVIFTAVILYKYLSTLIGA